MSDEPTDRDDLERLARVIAGPLVRLEPLDRLRARAVLTSDWYTERIAQAHREGATEVTERVEALPVHRIKVGWANCTEDMVSVTELRAALRGDT